MWSLNRLMFCCQFYIGPTVIFNKWFIGLLIILLNFQWTSKKIPSLGILDQIKFPMLCAVQCAPKVCLVSQLFCCRSIRKRLAMVKLFLHSFSSCVMGNSFYLITLGIFPLQPTAGYFVNCQQAWSVSIDFFIKKYQSNWSLVFM